MRRKQPPAEFKKVKAILHGHFVLASGLHSDTYVQCAKIFEHPKTGAELCGRLATQWRKSGVTVVAGPAYGGIIMAYQLAAFLKARAVYLERVEGRFTVRRGFHIGRRDRVLVAEDVVTTGGSAREVIDSVKSAGAVVVGVTSLVFRGTGKPFKEKFHYLVKVSPPTYAPGKCPMCAKKSPLEVPGSKQLVTS